MKKLRKLRKLKNLLPTQRSLEAFSSTISSSLCLAHTHTHTHTHTHSLTLAPQHLPSTPHPPPPHPRHTTMHPLMRSADTSVTIAPRLPVNPAGKFGPCSTDLPPPAPSLSSLPTWRATAQHCGVALRSSGGSGGQDGAGGVWGESLGVWVEDGERHVGCEAFASADYYPEEWILLDEVRGRGACKQTHTLSRSLLTLYWVTFRVCMEGCIQTHTLIYPHPACSLALFRMQCI